MTPLRARPSALLPILLLLTPPVLAQTRYEVEIVVFEQTPVGGGDEERWRPGIVVPEFERAGALESPGADAQDALDALPEAFEPLPADSARLRQTVQRLESSGRYRVLRHLHWRQPALGAGESLPVRVNAGEAIEIRVPAAELERPVPAAGNTEATLAEEADGDADAAEAEAAEAAEARDAEGGGGPAEGGDLGALDLTGPFGLQLRAPRIRRVSVQPLDGTVELVVSRYLHVHADLYYTTNVAWERAVIAQGGDAETDGAEDGTTTAAASASAPRIARGPGDEAMLSFPFKQRRRMRSGELHYLDHPLLGLLVLVTPYEEPEAAEGTGGGA